MVDKFLPTYQGEEYQMEGGFGIMNPCWKFTWRGVGVKGINMPSSPGAMTLFV